MKKTSMRKTLHPVGHHQGTWQGSCAAQLESQPRAGKFDPQSSALVAAGSRFSDTSSSIP
jgi:hypothetical protein